MTAERYQPMDGERDLAAVGRLMSLAFAGPQDGSEEWVRAGGYENVRVMRGPGSGDGPRAPSAALVLIPMGQWFGGRVVPMTGIAGVAVAPEARGRGLARKMMEEAMRETAAQGVPLSCLYASTQTLYRKVGFEQAGHRFEIRIPLHRLGGGRNKAGVRELTEDDLPRMKECHGAFAANFDGMLDRGPYCWRRVWLHKREPCRGFGMFDGEKLVAHVFMNQKRKPDTGRQELVVSDIAFVDAEAGRRVLAFLSDFAMIGDDVVFQGGPTHPLLLLMDNHSYEVTRRDYWMVRVCDFARAVGARGWPAGVRGAALVRVRDELIAGNDGLWRVTVKDGRGAAERVEDRGEDAVEVGPRGLASIYSGFVTPRQARLAGLATGSDEAVEAACGVFAGSRVRRRGWWICSERVGVLTA